MTHMTDDTIHALMSGAKSASGFFDMERAAPDLAVECLARGARIAELEAQAEYDRDLIANIRVALLKAQEAIIPTETLERWSEGMTIFNQTALDIRNEVDAIIAQRENRNE